MLSGYFITFLFLICLTSGIFLFGYTARKAGAVITTFLELVLGLFCVSLILVFQQHLSIKELFQTPTLRDWLFMGLAAISGFVGGNYFSLLNLKWGSEALNSLLSPAITATVVLFSVVTDKAALSFTQIIGVIITLTALIIFLLLNTGKRLAVVNRSKALWSGLATIVCISATIIFSSKGGKVGDVSIFHSIWLRMLMALPFVTVLALFEKIKSFPTQAKFYVVLTCAVALQTVMGSWLWFVASNKIGLPLFQTLVATLPFWVYGVDAYILKRSKPSGYFLVTTVVAVIGVWLAGR